MSEAYLIAASQGKISPISGVSHLEQVRPVLQALFDRSRVPARRVQEIHWHGGDDEFWFNPLGRSFGFAPELAGFHWPATALLAHAQLQNITRAIEAGSRDLVIMAQETGDQVVALLLASPSAVGIYNLSPRACLGHKFALASSPDGLLQAAFNALTKADEAQAEEDANGSPDVPGPPGNQMQDEGWTPVIIQPNYGQQPAADKKEADEVQWIATARRPGPDLLKAAFPKARWLGPEQALAPGDLFLLSALAGRLEEEKANRGLLISEGPQKSGLVTLVERV